MAKKEGMGLFDRIDAINDEDTETKKGNEVNIFEVKNEETTDLNENGNKTDDEKQSSETEDDKEKNRFSDRDNENRFKESDDDIDRFKPKY